MSGAKSTLRAGVIALDRERFAVGHARAQIRRKTAAVYVDHGLLSRDGEEPTMFDRYARHGLEAMDSNGPRLLFAEHHRELEKACQALIARAYEDDCHSLLDQYRSFEHHVREHMRIEEESILPHFERDNPAEATAIRAAHDVLRRHLEATACDIELHTVRIESLRQLVNELRRHAIHEDRVMYPWAQVHLPTSALQESWEHLTTSLRNLSRLSFVDGITHSARTSRH